MHSRVLEVHYDGIIFLSVYMLKASFKKPRGTEYGNSKYTQGDQLSTFRLIQPLQKELYIRMYHKIAKQSISLEYRE